MSDIDFNHFMAYCKQWEGKTLHTLYQKAGFRVSAVTEDKLTYIPLSGSQDPRSQKRDYIERVLDRFGETGSLRPKDYTRLTMNSSYILTLISMYQEAANQDRKSHREGP